jgi:hypothetical protein
MDIFSSVFYKEVLYDKNVYGWGGGEKRDHSPMYNVVYSL